MAPEYGQSGMQTAYHPPGPTSQETADVYDRYGIDRHGRSDNRDQVRTDAEQNVDQNSDGGGLFGQIIDAILRPGRVQDQYNQQMSQQAQALAQGVTTRPAPGIPDTNYMSYDHDSGLKPMVTDGVDPDQVGQMSDAWIEVGNGMTDFQQDFARSIASTETEWRGTAADSARQFMADTANYIGQAGQSAQLAGTQQGVHAQAVATARNSMPDPVPFSAAEANADLQSTTNPFEYVTKYAEHMETYQASQEAHQQAAQVLTTYDSSLSGSSTMPAFAAPPQMAGEGGGGLPPAGPGGPGGGGGAAGTFSGAGIGGGGAGGAAGSGAGITGGGVGAAGSGIGGIGGPGGGGTTTGAGANFPGGPGGIPGGGGGPGGGQVPGGVGGLPVGPMGPLGPGGTGGDSTRGPGGGRFPGGPGGPGSGRIPGIGGPGGGLGGPGSGAGRAGFGPGGSGFGSGSGAGGAGGIGSGSGTGAGSGAGARGAFGPGNASGVGALAAEQAAGGRGGAAGAAGRAGGAGMPMGAGAGRGQGGDDSEHQRPSFLVEPDPDEVFGTDQMTAPPVIGG